VKRLIAFALLHASGLFAQNLVGTWQGIVRNPESNVDLRTVLKIAAQDGDPIKANFYSIDQTYLTFPTTLTIQGSVIKMSIPGIGAGWEGKLSADGNSLVGTIKKGFPVPVPWTLKRVLSEDQAWALPKAPAPSKPMAADADPSFEVAVVKLSAPDARGRGMRIQGGNFATLNMSLADLMTFAYDVHLHQIVGAPEWFAKERYDITAKQEGEGTPSQDQWRIMLRKLLVERFQLALHRDKQELPVYTLNLAKGGSKISKSDAKNETPAVIFRGPGSVSLNNVSMADLSKLFQNAALDRPVVDQTGLPGRYDFSLIWTPDRYEAPVPNPNSLAPIDKADPPPDLFTAVQQQLGLKLDAAKLKIEVLVIDKAEKASEN
jgi:uncharacterized protein (TIGR03435 family)